jgi:hypothetical protein
VEIPTSATQSHMALYISKNLSLSNEIHEYLLLEMKNWLTEHNDVVGAFLEKVHSLFDL